MGEEGFNSDELVDPLRVEELREAEQHYKTLESWVKSGGRIGRVMRELGYSSRLETTAAVNRALDTWYQDRSTKVSRLIAGEDLRIMLNRSSMEERLEDGDLAAIELDRKMGESLLKMYGAGDAGESAPSVVIMGADLGATVVDGEAAEVVEELESGTTPPTD